VLLTGGRFISSPLNAINKPLVDWMLWREKMSNKNRFELALERLKSSDWARFEQLASEFLSSEYPSLRTVANPSGDEGRDSELFSSDASPKILFQYSVSTDWETKIKKTAARINSTLPEAMMLIYVTNQQIGAKGDDIKKKVFKNNELSLDIRDKSWFLDRMDSNESRQIAAERLAEEIVDALLKDRNIIDETSQVISDTESRAAYLYLTCHLEDTVREKGLTKLSYEAIIRSVLRETNSDNRMSRDAIKDEVRKILSSHSPHIVDQNTDNALHRMTKKYIRHWKVEDEFCLTHQERVRLSEELAKHEKERNILKKSIKELLEKNIGKEVALIYTDEVDALCTQVQRIIEKYLNTRGEKFALAVTTGKLPGLAHEDLKAIIIKDFSENPLKLREIEPFDLILNTINELFSSSSTVINNYLRSIADTYTLMAFLRETPDVQSSIKKIFSHGEIWLDTSIVLPLFAEQLIENEGKRFYTNILNASRSAGIKLRVIKGIIEEVNGHMKRSLACSRVAPCSWHGDVPFLLSLYVLSGRDIRRFASWIENFKGDDRPEDDLSAYLAEFFEIETSSLEYEVDKADLVLKGAVQEIWHEAHERRKKKKTYELDEIVLYKLVRHDVENYLGVICKRRKEKASPLGYSTWWLTLDSVAHKCESFLHGRLKDDIPSSPVLSLDFLSNYLTFGPLRRLKSEREYKLPIFMDKNFADYIPPELLDVAQEVRDSVKDLPEHVIRRKVRDTLEKEKRKIGKLTEGGTALMKDKIGASLDEIPLED